jgi:prepilin peptidase CpaA
MEANAYQIAMLALLGSALVYACYTDWTSRTIPNWLTGGISLAAPHFWLASNLNFLPGVAIQIGIGIVFFALFALFFALGAMGGGDVKLIAALGLWFPLLVSIDMLIATSLLGGALTIGFIIHRKINRITGPAEVPYGIAIALAGLWSIYERYLNHFG